EKLQVPDSIATSLISLGNVAYMQKESEAALKFYQRAGNEAVSPITQIQANLNQLKMLVEEDKNKDATVLAQKIESDLTKLPPNQTTIYSKINLAQSLIKLGNTDSVAKLLAKGIQEAQSIGDKRSESYATGSLGGLYEENKQWEEAKKLTEKALTLAQSSNATDIAYRWQWQLGRILR
ncbi:MAG TPA: hypothetical protein DD000_10720, partial [Cyanobacteria bacterium UBA11166]|nr:hypothetical protein [Cyanobacteria bacterium UBA11166]